MIMYYAGAEATSKPMKIANIKNILISYYETVGRSKEITSDAPALGLEPDRIFMDSGAFAAYNRNVEIDIYEYIRYLIKWDDWIEVYAGLDVIGNDKETDRNQDIMEEAGLSPLWTFHLAPNSCPDYNRLRKRIETNDYIALGGGALRKRRRIELLKHFDKCFKIMSEYNSIKVHGFGINSLDILKRYPFYSVDSTSYLRGTKYGNIATFKDAKLKTYYTGRVDGITMGNLLNADSAPERKTKKWIDRTVFNLLEAEKMGKFITDLWTARGVTWND